jgi:hypothetical protein
MHGDPSRLKALQQRHLAEWFQPRQSIYLQRLMALLKKPLSPSHGGEVLTATMLLYAGEPVSSLKNFHNPE